MFYGVGVMPLLAPSRSPEFGPRLTETISRSKMPNPLQIHHVSKEMLRVVANVLARDCAADDVILLEGTLAAGKTTFVGFIAEALGVTEAVASPTYTIAHTYTSKSMPILHMDVYRLSGVDEYKDLGFEDEFEHHLTIIEWGKKVERLHPDNLTITLEIDKHDDELRTVTFAYSSKRWAPVLSDISAALES
jgi:tRNA threonylcarbamoyladenosine biosynthesis protein TsaE